MTMLSTPGKSPFEPISLLLGLIAFVSSLLYFLRAYGIITIPYEITNDFLLIFFPALAGLCGIVLILSTIGMFGVR